MNSKKVCNSPSLNPDPLEHLFAKNLDLFRPISANIYRTGRAGSALCTAAHASTGIPSAFPGWASSPGTRL